MRYVFLGSELNMIFYFRLTLLFYSVYRVIRCLMRWLFTKSFIMFFWFKDDETDWTLLLKRKFYFSLSSALRFKKGVAIVRDSLDFYISSRLSCDVYLK